MNSSPAIDYDRHKKYIKIYTCGLLQANIHISEFCVLFQSLAFALFFIFEKRNNFTLTSVAVSISN